VDGHFVKKFASLICADWQRLYSILQDRMTEPEKYAALALGGWRRRHLGQSPRNIAHCRLRASPPHAALAIF